LVGLPVIRVRFTGVHFLTVGLADFSPFSSSFHEVVLYRAGDQCRAAGDDLSA